MKNTKGHLIRNRKKHVLIGIAIIIFLGQLRPFLGISKETSLISLFSGSTGFRYEIIVVGIVTIVGMLSAKKITKAIPSSLIGLLCGTGTYFVIGELFNSDLLKIENNPLIIGAIPSAIPSPKQLMNLLNMSSQFPIEKLTGLIIPALTLSVLASIDTLLTSVVTDMVTRSKHNSTKELFGQGIGNMTSAAFGSLPVAGSTLATLVNVNAGARLRLLASSIV